MFNVKSQFGTDKVKERVGVEVDLGGGAAIRVARMWNEIHTKEYEKLCRPHRLQIARNTLSDAIREKLLFESIARAVFIGMSGICTVDGVALEDTYENRLMLVTEYKDFREFVLEHANRLDHFRMQEEEDAEKN